MIKRINSFKQCYSKFCVFPFVEYHEPVQIVLDGQLTQLSLLNAMIYARFSCSIPHFRSLKVIFSLFFYTS